MEQKASIREAAGPVEIKEKGKLESSERSSKARRGARKLGEEWGV